uniref:Nuclear pore protein n=1 Tax=Phaeomonas parva TaxID=124430 RepID=A0A7S1Y0V1_9STRA
MPPAPSPNRSAAGSALHMSFLSTPSRIPQSSPAHGGDLSMATPLFSPGFTASSPAMPASAMHAAQGGVIAAPSQSNVDAYAAALAEVIAGMSADARSAAAAGAPCTRFKELEEERLRVAEGENRGEYNGGPQGLLVNLWDLLRFMLGEADASVGLPKGGAAPGRIAWGLAGGAKAFLQAQYMGIVDAHVAGGAVHAAHARIAAYVEQLEKSGALSAQATLQGSRVTVGAADVPFWPLLYMCLRCGALEEAVAVARAAAQQSNPDSDGAVFDCLEAAVAAQATGAGDAASWRSPAAAELRRRYELAKARGEEGGCPYRLTVLNLLSGADARRRSSVARTIEDYIWAGLWLAGAPAAAEPGAQGGGGADYDALGALERSIVGYGEAHFDPERRNPLAYALVLLQVQAFEKAVNYLAASGKTAEATHLALALDYYDVLKTEANHDAAAAAAQGNRMVLHTPGPASAGGEPELAPFVTLAPLVQLYTQRMVVADAATALAYVLRVREPYARLAQLVRLVRCNRQGYDHLLGVVREGDHRRTAGLLDAHLPDAEVKRVARTAGQKALQAGASADAIELFARAEDFHLVSDVLCEQLSASVVPPAGGAAGTGGERGFWQSAALSFLRKGIAAADGGAADEVLKMLLSLHSFFDLAARDAHQEALTTMQAMGLFPATNRDIADRVDTYHGLPMQVKRHFPEVLVTVMTCYQRLHHQLKTQAHMAYPSSTEKVDPTAQRLGDYRQRANVLVTFAGLLGLAGGAHMGLNLSASNADTAARLARLEVMMM